MLLVIDVCIAFGIANDIIYNENTKYMYINPLSWKTSYVPI